jgi:cyclic pyranopterin phosphate synthase
MLFAAEVAASLGVERIRVTGGEPLVRKGIIDFLTKLRRIDGINEITITTNGALLPKYAADLYKAGVERINISLDSLQEERFSYISGGFSAKDTIHAIDIAVATGFRPVKVNCVLIKGFNDDEILDFCQFAADKGVIVRFIEFMPIGNSPDWKLDNIMTGSQIVERIASRFEVMPLTQDKNAGPAKNYRLSNGATVGVITPMSEHFCGACDKLRLTADGKIRPCLLSDQELSVTEAVKAHDRAGLVELFKASLGLKDDEHHIDLEAKYDFKRTISRIGG